MATTDQTDQPSANVAAATVTSAHNMPQMNNTIFMAGFLFFEGTSRTWCQQTMSIPRNPRTVAARRHSGNATMPDTLLQSIARDKVTVAIGVCTFRRPSLRQTLDSLAQQSLALDVHCCVIVADNDDTPSALPLVENAKGQSGIALHYVHAPARNISVARNALLAKARLLGADYLAMIDDDEVAPMGWARHLLNHITTSGADAVLGKVTAVYSADTALWMRRSQLHDATPVIQKDGRILNGYTGNVMLRLDSPHLVGRHFDIALGRTGGEDDAFFHGMVRQGGVIGYAPDAITHEDVPRQRESLGFLLRRSFRAGQTHGMITQPDRNDSGTAIPLAKAMGKATLFLGLGAVHAVWPARRTRALMRMSLQLGICAHLLGRHTLELYKS